MNERPLRIDESIKVHSWGSESPLISPTQQQQFFQKYAAHPVPNNQQLYGNQSPDLESNYNQPASIDMNFKRLKHEQMEKLKNLKHEYEEIRNIRTNEYIGPRFSDSSSMKSSAQRSDFQDPSSEAQSKIRANGGGNIGGRQFQIVELEKKQLQIMLQNSMKKIEQLLHKEMQYKKSIHELKLQKESRSFPENDGVGLAKLLKKKERQFYDQIRSLELQRETLLYTMTGLKQKVKYLQSKLVTSEQELRKILQEKRDYEELIRMEKDKLMNLEIEFRRERKEFEIMEKDKNAEINMLLKERDIRASAADKELRSLTVNLQEELKLKEKRYTLLLQQMEKLQKEKLSEQKEQEVKLVNEILNTKTSEAPNQALQQTISSILSRLNELETKPAQRQIIEDLIHQNFEVYQRKDSEVEGEIQYYKDQITKLQNKLLSNERITASLKSSYQGLQAENAQLKAENESLMRKNKVLMESQYSLKEQLERFKLIDRKLSSASSRQHLLAPPAPKSEESNAKYEFATMKVSNLEKQVQELNSKLEESYQEGQKLEDENRELLNKMSRVEFQMTKTKQEGQFQLNLAKKAHETNYNILLQDLQAQKAQHTKAQHQIAEMRRFIQDHMEAGRRQIARLNYRIEGLLREKSSFDAQLKAAYNGDLDRIQNQYKTQIEMLTQEVTNLNEMNKQLQEKYNRSQHLLSENEELKHSLKTMKLQNSYGTPQREDISEGIMGSIAQHFRGQGNSSRDQDIVNSLFKGFQN